MSILGIFRLRSGGDEELIPLVATYGSIEIIIFLYGVNLNIAYI
jgi:hypothetical protein